MVRSFYCASYSDDPAIATPILGQEGIIVCTPDTLENAKSRDVLSGNWRQFCPQLHIYMCLSDRISQFMHQEGPVLGSDGTRHHAFIVVSEQQHQTVYLHHHRTLFVHNFSARAHSIACCWPHRYYSSSLHRMASFCRNGFLSRVWTDISSISDMCF